MKAVEHTQESIIARAKFIKAEVLQYFADIEHWNNTHDADHQIEADPDGKMQQVLDGVGIVLNTYPK